MSRTLLEFLKIEHTLFALPFVLAGMLVGFDAIDAPLDGLTFLLVVVAATGARTLGMTLNRVIDRTIDAANPRTANRALPAGTMSLRTAALIAVIAAIALIAAAAALNTLVLLLSPILVGLFVLYPYTKRFTWACHFVLGLTFLTAVAGGYLAITGTFHHSLAALPLGLAAMAWVTGFDIIYALLDVDHDQRHGIHSIPADLGEKNARTLAVGLHVLVILFLLIFTRLQDLGWPAYTATALAAGLLAWQHIRLDPRDPIAINKAFFNVNAGIGWIVLAGVIAGQL